MEESSYNKINDWLEGNMSDTEKKAFEAEMEKNPIWQEKQNWLKLQRLPLTKKK